MYPFGSGMPHPNSPPHHNQQYNNPGGMPFGAGSGWAMPPQNPSPPQQHPYPGAYPPQNNSPPQQPPYPGAGGAYPPYPMGGGNPTPYPPYPGNNHYQQPAPYPSMGQPQTSPYPQQQDNSRPVSQPPYPGAFNYIQHQPPAPSSQQFHQQPYHQQFAGHETYTQSQSLRKGTPTVIASQNFDPVKDAHDLRKAMKGFGTDEDTLINIICRRTNEQRQEIQRQYKTHFGKDLIEDIKSETSGNFENLLVGLLHPIVDFYCREICDAMAGVGTDEDVLIETLCTLSNHEIHTIKNAYVRMYGAHLESELKSETSGNFKRLLVSLCTGARDESGIADPDRAQIDARELLKAGELRIGTDESTFNMILCQRNYNQLKLTFQEYEKMTGHTLEKAIKKEFSGDIMEGLMAIYKVVTNKAEYFASRLHKSMAGLGTNDKQLIRVIVTRCEIDLQDIKSAFEKLYGKPLRSWVKGDTSGHYKHALYALIGEQRSS